MYSFYRSLFSNKKTNTPKYIRPDLSDDTPNNTNIRPVFQIRWKKDADDSDIATVFFLIIVKHKEEEHGIYINKCRDFCKEAINNVIYPWVQTLNNFHDINDWEMESLIIGNGYYQTDCDGNHMDCISIHDTLPNGNTMYEFDAIISFLEKDDLKVATFKEKCNEQLTNLYYEYFPNSI